MGSPTLSARTVRPGPSWDLTALLIQWLIASLDILGGTESHYGDAIITSQMLNLAVVLLIVARAIVRTHQPNRQ